MNPSSLYETLCADLQVANRVYIDTDSYPAEQVDFARKCIEKNPRMKFKDLKSVWVVKRVCIPKVTGRELIQMGYNPADHDLFRRIMWSLSEAIERGDARDDVLDSQITWVKENWPKND